MTQIVIIFTDRMNVNKIRVYLLNLCHLRAITQ